MVEHLVRMAISPPAHLVHDISEATMEVLPCIETYSAYEEVHKPKVTEDATTPMMTVLVGVVDTEPGTIVPEGMVQLVFECPPEAPGLDRTWVPLLIRDALFQFDVTPDRPVPPLASCLDTMFSTTKLSHNKHWASLGAASAMFDALAPGYEPLVLRPRGWGLRLDALEFTKLTTGTRPAAPEFLPMLTHGTSCLPPYTARAPLAVECMNNGVPLCNHFSRMQIRLRVPAAFMAHVSEVRLVCLGYQCQNSPGVERTKVMVMSMDSVEVRSDDEGYVRAPYTFLPTACVLVNTPRAKRVVVRELGIDIAAEKTVVRTVHTQTHTVFSAVSGALPFTRQVLQRKRYAFPGLRSEGVQWCIDTGLPATTVVVTLMYYATAGEMDSVTCSHRFRDSMAEAMLDRAKKAAAP